MNSILVTVGTSLLTNMQRDNLEATVQPVRLQYIREKGEQKASAETNSLRLLLEKMSPKNTKILFFHSDTEDGERCAKRLNATMTGRAIRPKRGGLRDCSTGKRRSRPPGCATWCASWPPPRAESRRQGGRCTSTPPVALRPR